MIKWWISEINLLISTWIDKSSTLEWVTFANSTSTCPNPGDLGKASNFEDSKASCNLDGNPPVFWIKSSGGAFYKKNISFYYNILAPHVYSKLICINAVCFLGVQKYL